MVEQSNQQPRTALETDTHIYLLHHELNNFHSMAIYDYDTSKLFMSSEHIYQYHKARFFDDKAAMDKIFSAHCTPAEAKNAGDPLNIRGYDDAVWKDGGHAEYAMLLALRLKFDRNLNYSQAILLLATGDKILVEANPKCEYWSCGLAIDDPLILNETNWTGENRFGKLLMQVREEIK